MFATSGSHILLSLPVIMAISYNWKDIMFVILYLTYFLYNNIFSESEVVNPTCLYWQDR